MKMYAEIVFDRDIDFEKHYISPGGYTMTFAKSGKVSFDFLLSEKGVDTNNKRLLRCWFSEEDETGFPEDCPKLRAAITNGESVVSVDEFFVYCGDDENEEINPVAVKAVVLSCGTKNVGVSQKVLKKAYIAYN